MIWIIGGTHESHQLIKAIEKHNLDYIISVATEGGLEFLKTENYFLGRMDYSEMLDFINRNKIKHIVDMSHPFATIVTANAKKAAEEKSIEYYRFVREYSILNNDSILVDSYESCYEVLKELEGNFFFTTGSKKVEEFESVKGNNRFIYRMLPTSESIGLAEKSGIEMKDIIGMLGPFTIETNVLFFKMYDINYCVTKESGGNSGFNEKIKACEETGVIPIVIKREKEEGYKTIEEIVKLIVERNNE